MENLERKKACKPLYYNIQWLIFKHKNKTLAFSFAFTLSVIIINIICVFNVILKNVIFNVILEFIQIY